MNCTDVDDVVDLGCRGRSDIAELVGGDGMSFYIVVSLVLVGRRRRRRSRFCLSIPMRVGGDVGA